MGRPPCCDKANVKRGLWTPEEDAKILAYVANHGIGNWAQVPKKAGLNRCGKSCRLRWTNYLRPDLKHEEFTGKEEELIVQYHAAIGSRWSLIAKHLPGRTDNDVKNYWNTKLKKKLMKMGIDPITHKPIAKIFSDYESIRYLTTNNQTSSLDNNLAASLSSQCRISPAFQQGIQTTNTIMMPMVGHFNDYYSTNSCLLQRESFNHDMEELSPSSSTSSSSSISNGQPSSCLLANQPASSLTISVAYSFGEQTAVDPLPAADVREEHNIQVFLASDVPGSSQHPNLPNELPNANLNSATEVKSSTSNFSGTAMTTDMSSQFEPSSSVSSFVKALLDRDSEMQLCFPAFNDILDY